MTDYAALLQEAISSANFPKASLLIRNYLRKNLGTNQVYLYPEPEHFSTVGHTRVGIRYFINKIESVRFNWLSDGSIDGSKNLVSIDYWNGMGKADKPSFHVEFDKGQSLVKTLPIAAALTQSKLTVGKIMWIEDENLVESILLNMNSDFSTIQEAKSSGGDGLQTIINVIRAFGEGLNQKDFYAGKNPADTFGPGLNKVLAAVKTAYPEYFEKQGVAVVFKDKNNAKKMTVDKIANVLGIAGVGATVSVGTAETQLASKEVQTMEENLPRLAYEEQLEDLRRAMVLLMNNATQGLFLSGRGGVGKTAVVEEELHKRGLTDGEGYFKITGSASTAGIYRILYEHRKDILLFDDSDGALADQDSRNLFKAASDTKKIRKIAWMKAGKNYVDPDDLAGDDTDDPDLLPRYFDFSGKIIFISNLAMQKLDPDGALRTRAFVINIDPTDLEVYDYMAKIVNKINLDVDFSLSDKQRQEVINILRSRKLKEGSTNLRQLVRGLNMMAGILKDGGDNYHQMILRYA